MMAKEKKKKISHRRTRERLYGFVAGYLRSRKSFLDLFLVIFAIFLFLNSMSNQIIRVEEQIKPISAANLVERLVKVESDIKNIDFILRTQTQILSNIYFFRNYFDELKEEAKKYLNPATRDEVQEFLAKMKEKEFMEISNSSLSREQKVFEIIAKIGGNDKLIDILKIKDPMLGLGIVTLYIENYNF